MDDNKKSFQVKRDGKVVGTVHDGVFEKHVVEGKHLMWKYGGVPAIDAELFERLKTRITDIVIKTDRERVFRMTCADFDTKKKELDHGFGRQYYCELGDWKMDSKKLVPAFDVKEKVVEKQQSLF